MRKKLEIDAILWDDSDLVFEFYLDNENIGRATFCKNDTFYMTILDSSISYDSETRPKTFKLIKKEVLNSVFDDSSIKLNMGYPSGSFIDEPINGLYLRANEYVKNKEIDLQHASLIECIEGIKSQNKMKCKF